VVVFACTSAGAMLGAEGDARLIQDIAQTADATVVSTNDAVGACIASHNPRSVAVITPYVYELNAHIPAGLERRGLHVTRVAGLGLTNNLDIAAVSPAQILEHVDSVCAELEFDLLFVSCTNFRGVEAREALISRFGVPVGPVIKRRSTRSLLRSTVELTRRPRWQARRGRRRPPGVRWLRHSFHFRDRYRLETTQGFVRGTESGVAATAVQVSPEWGLVVHRSPGAACCRYELAADGPGLV
jgi:hypothetical protein